MLLNIKFYKSLSSYSAAVVINNDTKAFIKSPI